MKISYVVLYLNDTKKGLEFWTNKMGYEKKSETKIGDQFVYKVGKKGEYTNFELVPLKLMENNPNNLSLGIPSIAFEVNNLQKAHNDLIEKGIKVSDIMNQGEILSFALFDEEDNAFAVIENKE